MRVALSQGEQGNALFFDLDVDGVHRRLDLHDLLGLGPIVVEVAVDRLGGLLQDADALPGDLHAEILESGLECVAGVAQAWILVCGVYVSVRPTPGTGG